MPGASGSATARSRASSTISCCRRTSAWSEVHSRAGDLWRERFVSAGAIELDDPDVRIEVEAIYAGTDIAARPSRETASRDTR